MQSHEDSQLEGLALSQIDADLEALVIEIGKAQEGLMEVLTEDHDDGDPTATLRLFSAELADLALLKSRVRKLRGEAARLSS